MKDGNNPARFRNTKPGSSSRRATRKCYPCVRYDVLPVCQAAQFGPLTAWEKVDEPGATPELGCVSHQLPRLSPPKTHGALASAWPLLFCETRPCGLASGDCKFPLRQAKRSRSILRY